MITIKKDKHKGRRCFIIASGPSLKNVDLEPLRNEITIAVNESYKAMPFEPTYICIGDYKLWPRVKKAYAKMKNTGIIVGTGLDGSGGSDYSGNNLLAVLPLDKRKSIATDGFHWDIDKEPLRKGFGVIPEVVFPFVCFTGFEATYLLGCDCKQNGYAYRNPVRGKKEQLIDDRVFKAFEAVALKSRPTRIHNLTEGSALQCFHQTTLQQVLFPKQADIKDYQVVGYYTPNQNYKELAERMQASVRKQGLACDIFERSTLLADRDPPMPWVANCAQCAEFILTMFEKYNGKHILYLDADAVMEKFPDLLVSSSLPEFDIAAPFLTNKWVSNELTSNTLIFRRTPKAKEILKAWAKEQAARVEAMLEGEYRKPYKEVWDQKVLQDVLKKTDHKLFKLPWEYAKITRTPKGEELMKGVNIEDIVISQHQCSRQNKRKVGTND